MKIFPLLLIGSPDKDIMFFNGGLAKIGDSLFCSARDGVRKHRGTDRVEVLSDAALFEINIKNIYQCEKIEEIIEKFHYNNPVYKREKYILYSEVEVLREKGLIKKLPGARDDLCREDHRFLYLGKEKWAFIYNTWTHKQWKELEYKGEDLQIINTATQIAMGSPEKFFSDAEFYDPLIDAEKAYGIEPARWPYKSLLFAPIIVKNGRGIKLTDTLAGRFRPMDEKGHYCAVKGAFKENKLVFKSCGTVEGMNYIGEKENLHVSPSTNPLLLKITDKKGNIEWFNFYMDHRRSEENIYTGHFQITDLTHKKILYFEKTPSLEPAEMLEKAKDIKDITQAKLKKIENVAVPYGLVSLPLKEDDLLLISHGMSDSYWQLSGLWGKEVIKSIEEEVKKYRKKIADEKIISLFEMGIEDAKFMNYNDVF